VLRFQAVRNQEITFEDLIADLKKEDLAELTNELTEIIIGLILDCVDAHVGFVPNDPDAYDPYAEDEEDVDLAAADQGRGGTGGAHRCSCLYPGCLQRSGLCAHDTLGGEPDCRAHLV